MRVLPIPAATATDPAGPPPAGLRDRKKLQARAAIVDAALDLFAEDGFDATTVSAIAARAGVSPATVARYFPSKEALLFPERGARVPVLRAAILARPAGEPPLRAILGALDDQAPLDAGAQRRLVLTRRAIARSAVLRGRSLGLLEQWRDGVAEAVAEREGLSPAAARVLATAVVAVLDDVADRWAADGGRGDLREATRDALAVLAGPPYPSPSGSPSPSVKESP